MIVEGTIFRLGKNFRPNYLHEALVKVKTADQYEAQVEIVEMKKTRPNGRFYVGGTARIPVHLIPRDVLNATLA